MKRIALLILAFTHVIGVCNAQTEVTAYQPGVTVEGITYFLPRTALRVTVVAERKVTTPGQLAKYAFRYLRLNDVPTTATTVWTIKEVNLDAYGMPDPTKAYSIKLKNRTLAPLASLTQDGILLSINAEQAEQTLPTPPQGKPATPPADPRRYMSQEILTAGSTAKMAELCAREIYDIRESRSELIRGEADNTPKDGQQLQLMLNQLDTQSAALEQLFSGTTQTSTEVFTFTYVPTHEAERDVLFRFSQLAGVVDRDDLSGAPVYISIRPTNSLPPTTPNGETNKKKGKLEQGIYYNVPAREKVTVFDADHTFATTEVSMGQFGNVEILGEALFDKKSTTRAFFHQTSGGLQRLEQ